MNKTTSRDYAIEVDARATQHRADLLASISTAGMGIEEQLQLRTELKNIRGDAALRYSQDTKAAFIAAKKPAWSLLFRNDPVLQNQFMGEDNFISFMEGEFGSGSMPDR